ncbi:MAG: hypothetical protein V7711_09040 [Pseudomonadales bacterium]
MSDMTLPEKLHHTALMRIVERYDMQEVLNDEGGPFLPLTCHAPFAEGAPIGHMRIFRGGPLFQVVTSSIVVPQIQLDSHMVFAFTPSDSAVPHFTVDSVMAGDHFAFHLDLIPRMDLGSRLAYLNEVFQPLTEACEEARADEGFTKAQLSPRQWAIMSPWMMANRASEESFPRIEKTVTSYQNHWFELMDKGISAAALDGVSREELIARDQRNKAVIFNPEVDPVWQKIAPLVGEEANRIQIETLKATSE